MHTELHEQKQALRRELRARLLALGAPALQAAGASVARHLEAFLKERASLRPGAPVAIFASLAHELRTAALDALLRDLAIPRALPAVTGGELVFRLLPEDWRLDALPKGGFAVPTPPASLPHAALGACAAVIVPGLGFDEEGRRLGHGKGYYDRALAAMRQSASPPPAIAVLTDAQWLDTVPCTPLDVPVDGLCSPDRGLVLLPGAASAR